MLINVNAITLQIQIRYMSGKENGVIVVEARKVDNTVHTPTKSHRQFPVDLSIKKVFVYLTVSRDETWKQIRKPAFTVDYKKTARQI